MPKPSSWVVGPLAPREERPSPPRRPDAGRRTSQTWPSARSTRRCHGDAGGLFVGRLAGQLSQSLLAMERQSTRQRTHVQRGFFWRQVVAPRSMRAWTMSPLMLLHHRKVPSIPPGRGGPLYLFSARLFRRLCRRLAPSRQMRSRRPPLKCRCQHPEACSIPPRLLEILRALDLASTGDEIARPRIIAEASPF